MKVAILNSGLGSIHSLQNILSTLDIQAEVITSQEQLKHFNRIIIPGIGNFSEAATWIKCQGWDKIIGQFISNQNNRVLGICLGMQLLFGTSEECNFNGRGFRFFNHNITRLKSNLHSRVPNVGWAPVHRVSETGVFISDNLNGCDFYFVHSYALIVDKLLAFDDDFDEYATTKHGGHEFVSMFRKGNLYGCQFHPEKSSYAGQMVFKSFLSL